jgi:ADP-heptose:LPS heptosyltransferase
LVVKIAERWPKALILLTGAPAEFHYVEAIRLQAQAAGAVNLTGQIGFTELPALYHLAHAMVTNDSGPGHFAAVTPLKTVVLFGPETPVLYGSMGDTISVSAGLSCSPCVSAANHRKTACNDNVCMKAISVEQVLLALGQQIERTTKDTRPGPIEV